MDTLTVQLEDGRESAEQKPAEKPELKHASVPTMRWRTLLALPAAAVVALVVHWLIAGKEPEVQTRIWTNFLLVVLGISAATAGLQIPFPRFRNWLNQNGPIFAAAILLFCAWEIITTGLRLLPLPYFPSPAGVLHALVDDWRMLVDCTWHSLILLACGYLLGVAVGIVTGIGIGWFPFARYWGMPMLKVIGPIPATAWVPLAMVLSPSGKVSAIGLVALAVWFPVTMLTISGVANTKASYIDVARTLGASSSYLIFRVAVPAAMPSIFIGLFMGLGASFLTLIVAETVGVKAGLGWYLGWAQAWAEYGKVFAALVIMAAFFSTIMTMLFKVRDRVLVWQKGVIKW